jgi:hypothetical protein
MAHLIERLLDRSVLVPPSRVSNLTPVCERCVLTYSHYFDVFMWSGNHKFYIQFSRLIRLQSFRLE